MFKRLLTVLFILTAALSNSTRAAEPVPVIFDTDIGSDIDDMVALSLILKSPELDLKLVTTASEDTRYRAQVAAKFLTKAGRTDIPVGMGERFEGKAEFHKPWVADFALSDYQGDIIEDGAGAIIQLLKQSSDPVTIIVAGPMHNIAAVLERAPELAAKMRVVGMHGSIYKGYGDEPSAEYNVQNNVPAFRKVLHAPLHSFTITPLDTCGDMFFEGEQYQQLKNSTDKQLEVIFENYPIWAGLVTWENADYLASRSSVMYDAVAVYLALPDHSWLPAEPMHLSVTREGFTVPADSGPQVKVALEWANRDAFKQWFVERMLTSTTRQQIKYAHGCCSTELTTCVFTRNVAEQILTLPLVYLIATLFCIAIDYTGMDMATKTAPINMRVEPSVRNIIDAAATVLKVDRTVFIQQAALAHAKEVLASQRDFLLNDTAFAAFEEAMDQPANADAGMSDLLNRKAPWE